MSRNITARSAGFSDRLYASLLVSRICLEMCSTHLISATRIKKIDQIAIRV